MPRYHALKAEISFALLASYLLDTCLCYLNYHVIAFGTWTVLFQPASHYLLISLESHELLISLFICQIVHKTVSDPLSTSLKWTLDLEPFAPRLSYLKCQKVTIAVFAEVMPTCLVWDKLIWVMIIVAYFTELLLANGNLCWIYDKGLWFLIQ